MTSKKAAPKSSKTKRSGSATGARGTKVEPSRKVKSGLKSGTGGKLITVEGGTHHVGGD